MSARKEFKAPPPFKVIDFIGGSAFARKYPVDLRLETVKEVVATLPSALDTGLDFRGSSVTEMTLMPGVMTSPALGEVLLLGASRNDIIDFRARQLVTGDIAADGMTLAALQVSRDSGLMTDFSLTAINGENPTADYVEVGGYQNDQGKFEYTLSRFSPSHKLRHENPLDQTAIEAFVRSVRECSSAAYPTEDSIEGDLQALLIAAPNKLITRTGEYKFDEGIELSVDATRLTREGMPQDLITYSLDTRQILSKTTDSSITLLYGVKRGYDKKERTTYDATIGMACLDNRAPSARASQFEMFSNTMADRPEAFFTALGEVAQHFASPSYG